MTIDHCLLRPLYAITSFVNVLIHTISPCPLTSLVPLTRLPDSCDLNHYNFPNLKKNEKFF